MVTLGLMLFTLDASSSYDLICKDFIMSHISFLHLYASEKYKIESPIIYYEHTELLVMLEESIQFSFLLVREDGCVVLLPLLTFH